MYQKYYSNILYMYIQSLLTCPFMQTVLYANRMKKEKKKGNHLRENEQLMHIEYKNPYEFFSSLEVSKGHWIIWRLISPLKNPILPGAIKLFLSMTTDMISEPKAVLCRSLYCADASQSMDASLWGILTCCLHSLLVFNSVGSFPVTFAQKGFEWIAQLLVLSPNSTSEPNLSSSFLGGN